jgi:hypothetical protein
MEKFGFHHIFRFLFEQMIREIIDKTATCNARRCCVITKKLLKLATVSISWKSVAFSASRQIGIVEINRFVFVKFAMGKNTFSIHQEHLNLYYLSMYYKSIF